MPVVVGPQPEQPEPTPVGRASVFGQDSATGFHPMDAVYSGVLQHPIFGPAAEWAGRLLGLRSDQVYRLKHGVGVDTPVEKGLQWVGEWGPDILFGAGAYMAGSRLGVAGVRTLAEAYRANAGRQLTAVLTRAARAADIAKVSGDLGEAVASGLPATGAADAARATLSGLMRNEMRQPMVERMFQLAGGNMGFGAWEGLKTLSQTGDPDEAAKSAAWWSLVGGGTELGLTLGAKALTGRARFIDPAAIEARAAGPRAELAQLHAKATADVNRIDNQIQLITAAQQNLQAIQQAGGVLTRPQQGALRKIPGILAKFEDRKNYATTLQLAFSHVDEAAGLVNYTRERPAGPRGPMEVLYDMGRKLFLTAEGMKGQFGAMGGQVMEALQQAFEVGTLNKTFKWAALDAQRTSGFNLLKFGTSDRTPIKEGLLLRLQHEREKPGGSLQAVVDFLTNPPDHEVWNPITLGTPGGSTGTRVTTATREFNWRKLLGGRGLSPAEAQAFAQNYETIMDITRSQAEEVWRVGGERLMTPAEKRDLGVAEDAHFTHITEPGSNDAYIYDVLRKLYDEPQAQRIMHEMELGRYLPSQHTADIMGTTAGSQIRGFYSRIGKFGAHDFTRTIRGTAWEKYISGLPVISDPWQAAMMATGHGSVRAEVAKVLGPRGELVQTYGAMVRDEALKANQDLGKPLGQALRDRLQGRADMPFSEAELNAEHTRTLFESVLNETLDHKYYQESLVRMVKFLTSTQVAAKLGLGVFSNAVQMQNPMMMMGFENTVKGLWNTLRGIDPITGLKLVKGEPAQDALRGALGQVAQQKALGQVLRRDLEFAVALPHTLVRGAAGALDSGVLSQRSERVAEALLRWSLFSSFEVFNRWSSALVGRFTFRDTLMRAASGELRGGNLDHAIRMMADLGVNLGHEVDNLLRQGADHYFASPEVKELTQRVSFAAAQRTQFIPSKFRKPTFWQTPYGRVMFQFKTFALHQGRLMRDHVLAELANGNVKPMATALALTPVASETVESAKDFFRQGKRPKENNPIVKIASTALNFGAFALAGEFYQSMLHGDLGSMLGGPTLDSLWELMSSVATNDPGRAKRHLLGLPTSRLAIKLMDIGSELGGDVVDQWHKLHQGTDLTTLGAVQAESTETPGAKLAQWSPGLPPANPLK